MPTPDQFIHRYLEPFHESFCRLCAKQAGMAKEESGLQQFEKDHVCDSYFVEMLRKRGADPVEYLERIHGVSN